MAKDKEERPWEFKNGNDYWKLRQSHGRKRALENPEELAECAERYFKWCVDNPITECDYKGKDAIKVEYDRPRVFKKDELARFCGLSCWDNLVNYREYSDDFSELITRIEGIIYDQKYTHAAIGQYNASIIARDLKLSDKKEISANVTQTPVINIIDPSEIEEDEDDNE